MVDAIGGAVQLVVGLVRTHKLNEWAKLCFAMMWSYSTAFSFAAGSALVARQPAGVAIGSGMVMGAAVTCFLFGRSPLTKKLMVAIPEELVMQAETRERIVTVERK